MSTPDSPGAKLDAETKLAINEYLGQKIDAYAKWFGVANLVAAVLGLGYIFFVLPGTATDKAMASLSDALKDQTKFIVEARVSAEGTKRAAEEASDIIKATRAMIGGSSRDDIENARRLLELAKSAGQLEQLPVGAIVAFSATKCPVGWAEYAPAYGRFIRGIDKSGKNFDPSGERAPGNIQEDAFQGHWHDVWTNKPGNAGPGLWGGTSSPIELYTKSSQMNATAVGVVGDGANGQPRTDKETRPRNVALLFCERRT